MKQETIPHLLSEFMKGITMAEGGAAHMVHHHLDPRFIPIRENLSIIKKKCMDIAIKASNMKVQHVTRH